MVNETYIGRKITCIIGGILIDDAEIIKEDGEYFILNDIKDGKECSHKKDYEYSWCINSGNLKDIKYNKVENIIFKEQIYELW